MVSTAQGWLVPLRTLRSSSGAGRHDGHYANRARRPAGRFRPRGRAGTRDLRQSGDRVHDRQDRSRARRSRSDHGGGTAAGRAGGRVPADARPVDEPPEVRQAVRGALLYHRAAGHHPGHPAIPGLGPDQGHRPGDGRAHGHPLRRRHHAHHRRRARPPDRGRRPRPQAYRDDHRRLGRAEGHQGGDGVPAGCRGVHLAGGADLQEVRRRLHLRGARRAVPAGLRRVGHRLQDRGHHRRGGRHRPGQPGADQGRAGLHPVRGGRRRPLLPARAQPDRRRGQDPRGPGGA